MSERQAKVVVDNNVANAGDVQLGIEMGVTQAGVVQRAGLAFSAEGSPVLRKPKGATKQYTQADTGGTIDLAYDWILLSFASGSNTIALPDGSVIGQQIKIKCNGVGGTDFDVTGKINSESATTAVFDAAGETLILEWAPSDDAAGAFGKVLLNEGSITIS